MTDLNATPLHHDEIDAAHGPYCFQIERTLLTLYGPYRIVQNMR